MNTGTLDAAIGRHPTRRKSMAVRHLDGRAAVTHYRVIQRFGPTARARRATSRNGRPEAADDVLNGLSYTLLEMTLGTGRTHQIRSHLASIGHPCFGDVLYGGRSHHRTTKSRTERALVDALLPLIERQALHARGLGFTHPTRGEWCYFEAPLPADMQALHRRLEDTEADLSGTSPGASGASE